MMGIIPYHSIKGETGVWTSWNTHPLYIKVKKKYQYIDSIKLWLKEGPVTLTFELYDGDILIAKKIISTSTGYYATPWFKLGFLIPETNKQYKFVLTHEGSDVSTEKYDYEDEYVKIWREEKLYSDWFIYEMKLIRLLPIFRQ